MSGRRRLQLSLLVAGLLLVWDLSRPPTAQVTAGMAIGLIHGYQHLIAPGIETVGVRCRFSPSCSRYAEAVIRQHGLVGGGLRTGWRLLRCGPWTPSNTLDPP